MPGRLRQEAFESGLQNLRKRERDELEEELRGGAEMRRWEQLQAERGSAALGTSAAWEGALLAFRGVADLDSGPDNMTAMADGPRRPCMKKKRPAPEGAGLPGVVPSDIVNWEGNYILDTNTFLIVISHP